MADRRGGAVAVVSAGIGGGVLFARQPALLLESLFRGKQELNNHVRVSTTLLVEEYCLWNVQKHKNMPDNNSAIRFSKLNLPVVHFAQLLKLKAYKELA